MGGTDLGDDDVGHARGGVGSGQRARGLGQALRRAHQGTLQMQLSPDQDLMRLDWSR